MTCGDCRLLYPDITNFCGQCGAPLRVPETLEFEEATPSAPVGTPGPRSKGLLGGLVAVGLCLTVAVVVGVGVNASNAASDSVATASSEASDDSGETSDDSDPAEAEFDEPAPLTPAERCVATVMRIMEEVPDALREGYDAGVSLDGIITEYGYQSPEFRISSLTQAQLLMGIKTTGDPEGKVAAVRAGVEQECASQAGT